MREESTFVRAVVTTALVVALALLPACSSPAETLWESGVVVGAANPQSLPATTMTDPALRRLAELAHAHPNTRHPDARVASSLASGPATALSPDAAVAPKRGPKVNSAGQLIDERGQFLSGAGGESEAAAAGRVAHERFDALAEAKGWKVRPRIKDASGEIHIPDALNSLGRPVELKPGTLSGYRRGLRALKRYKLVTAQKVGRVIYYDPVTGKLIPFWWPGK